MIQFIIENEQDKLEFTDELSEIMQKAVATTLQVVGGDEETDFEVSVLITDDEGIHQINKETRDIDSPTDVLSFPILEFDEDGVMIEESNLSLEGVTVFLCLSLCSFKRNYNVT